MNCGLGELDSQRVYRVIGKVAGHLPGEIQLIDGGTDGGRRLGNNHKRC